MADDDILDDDRGYLAWADDFQESVTPAEGHRAIQVRAFFLAALVEDQRVVRRLPALLEQMRAAHDAPDSLLEAAERDDPVVEGSALDFSAIGRQLVREELHLHWPWVLDALLRVAHRMLTRGIDEPRAALPPIGEFTVFAPAFKIDNPEGNPIDAVIGEVRELLRRLEQIKAEAIGDQPGKAVRADGAYLQTWARWYYEARVQRPPKSVRSIAATRHAAEGHPGPFEQHDCDAYVRKAIKEAERLLSLGRYRF